MKQKPESLMRIPVTISKSGPEVRVHCDSGEDAYAIFDWLSSLGDKGDMNGTNETSILLTLEWCEKNLIGCEKIVGRLYVEFIVAKCGNGSTAVVMFKVGGRKPRVYVSNFYVDRIRTVKDLRDLIVALGFGHDSPWNDMA